MNVILESPILCALFRKFKFLKEADDILLFWTGGGKIGKIKLAVFKKLVRALAKKEVRVQTIQDHEYFRLNPRVVQVIEENYHRMDEGLALKLKALLQGSEQDISKYIKKRLIDILAKKVYIRHQLLALEQEASCLIITGENTFGVYDGAGTVWECGGAFFQNRVLARLMCAMAAFFVFIKSAKKIKFVLRRAGKFTTELLVQANTLGYQDDIRKEFLSEHLVFDKHKVSLLLTDIWRFRDETQMEKYKEYLKDKGIRYVDVKDFVLDARDVCGLFKTVFKYVMTITPSFRSWDDFYVFCQCLKDFFSEAMYLCNYNCMAILSFDDYMANHVVRTLLCRPKNIKTFGIQHSAANGLYGIAHIAYVCFDKYFIFGNFYKELFSPFWDHQDIVKLSYNRIDRFLQKWESSKPHKSPYPQLVKNVKDIEKKNILITLPTILRFEDFFQKYQNGPGMLNFLRDMDDMILSKANLFIRPKTPYGIEGMKRYLKHDQVQFIVDDTWTTTELLAHADLVIASNGSAIIAECCLLRVRALTYDYLGFLKKHWLKFGKDMCCDSAEQLSRVLHAFLCGEFLDIDWEYLWADIVYPNNGNTNKIIEGLLYETSSEVKVS